MPTGLSQIIIINEALQLVAAQTQVTANDGSPAWNAASVLYAPTVQMLLRLLDPDFARCTVALSSVAGGGGPVITWAQEYGYPVDCLRLRQVRPAAGTYDANDPQPVRSNIAYDASATNASKKVILTNQSAALGVYTTSNVTEVDWDADFQDAVVRRLANPLAMALSGRPDFARELFEEAAKVAAMADSVDESMIRPG